MQFHQFLQTAGSLTPAPTKAVRFKALAIDPRTAGRLIVDVRAAFAFVTEHERQEAVREAGVYLRSKHGANPIPEDERADEELYQVLYRALRDADSPATPLFANVGELRGALHVRSLRHLIDVYTAFCADEFPEDGVSKREMDGLVRQAEKNS